MNKILSNQDLSLVLLYNRRPQPSSLHLDRQAIHQVILGDNSVFISFNPYLHHNACVYFYVGLICFLSLSWFCYFSNILCSDRRRLEPLEKEPDSSRSALYLQTTDQTEKCVLLQCLVFKCPNLTFWPWESSTSLKRSCGG